MYLAMSLTLGLSVFASDEASEPRYLWRQCQNRHDSNFYNSELEVQNVFENDTIKMTDYAGQVITNSINSTYQFLKSFEKYLTC